MRGHTQIVTPLADGSALAISSCTELERGARGILLLVDDAFRLDGTPMGGHCAFVARRLNDFELSLRVRDSVKQATDRERRHGLWRELAPHSFDLTVEIHDDERPRRADILVGTVQIPERGTTRLTAQAIVRDSDPDRAR